MKTIRVLIIRSFPDILDLDSYNVQEIGLAHALRQKGLICDIVFYNGIRENRVQRLDDGTVIYWRRGLSFLKNAVFPGLWSICRKYDVLQVHEYDQIQSWLLYSFKRVPIVIYHGPYGSDYTKGYNKKCRIFDKLFLPFSGYARKNVYCIGKSPLAAEFLSRKGFEHTTAIGVGLNTNPLDRATEKDDRIISVMPSNRVNLIYVGKLEKRRNTEFLLGLIGKLISEPVLAERIHFTIVGNGDRQYVQRLESDIRELESTGGLTWIPKASQQELAMAYKKADIMLFPSNYEIFGMVILEAMYYGCVCISSYNGGSSTVITDKEDGIIVNKFDYDVWEKAVRGLVTDDALRAEMSDRAARKISESFTWGDISEQFISVYEKTIENNENIISK